MKNSTVQKYIDILKEIKESGKSIKAYCEENGLSVSNIYRVKCRLEVSNELYREFMTLYHQITKRNYGYDEEILEEETSTNEIDKITIVRDSEEKIIEYKIHVPLKDKEPFEVDLTRREVEDIFGLYTYYGGNITARNVANEFPRFTLPEVKRIIRAFGITKDSAWFPPHLLEEMDDEQLTQYRMNLKERAAFKYADATQEREFKNTLNKMASEINRLSNYKNLLSDVMTNFNPILTPKKLNTITSTNSNVLVLYLSDMHIGAKVESGSLFNNVYNEKIVFSRIDSVIEHLCSLKTYFKRIIIADCGDAIDGIDNQTARREHYLPQNMDNQEQANNYLSAMFYLFESLFANNLAEKYSFISVSCGNHGGFSELLLHKLFESQLNLRYPEVETKVADKYYLQYNIYDTSIFLHHGKDDKFMKKNFPMYLNNDAEVKIDQFIRAQKDVKKNIHVVSGDLHNEAMSRGKFFKYWKVGSFFGSSDYCMYGFGNTPAHANYHIINKDNTLLMGTIELQ